MTALPIGNAVVFDCTSYAYRATIRALSLSFATLTTLWTVVMYMPSPS
ncbi:hypothetical protein GGE65_006225 [Skermanella aerolata]